MKASSTHVCLFLFVFSFFLLPFSLLSQDWSQQHPKVDLNQLKDIYISQDNYGWAVGQKIIFKTSDGGATWENLTNLPSSYYTYEMIEYIEGTNGQRFYLASYNVLYETTDGGATWNPTNFGGAHAKAMHIAANHYLIYTENGIYHSTDDGANWTAVLNPTKKILSMTFSSDSFGAASTEDGEIYYTNDGGASWILSSVTPGSSSPVLAFATDQIGYASINKDVFKTTDGGQSWTIISNNTVNPFYVFEAISETELFATRGSAIYHSTDSGVNWTRGIDFNYARNVSGIHALAGKVWIVGNYGSIFQFDGNSWQDLNPANKNGLVNIVFYNDQIGVAVGYDRTILKTLDGGQNWLDLSDKLSDFQTFNDVYFFSENEFMIAGEDGLLKTTDGGQNWTMQLFPSTSELFDFTVSPGSNKIYVSGSAGAVFVSDDNGQNWSDIGTSENDKYRSLSFPTALIGYVASSYGGMLKTMDGGTNWNPIFPSSTQGFVSISFLNESAGYVLERGYIDIIKHTTDGGNSWSSISLPVKSYWQKVLFVDDQKGWVIGGTSGNGKCYQTTDGGATWELIYQASISLTNIAVVNDGTADQIWVCGIAGVIAKMDAVVATTQAKENTLTIHPNPLTTSTLIIQGINTSFMDIAIYTLSGKMLFSARKHPAQESIQLENLRNGLYIVRVLNSDTGVAYFDKLLIMN